MGGARIVLVTLSGFCCCTFDGSWPVEEPLWSGILVALGGCQPLLLTLQGTPGTMEISPDMTLETVGLFVALVWPGLLAVNVYRLIVPGPKFEWKDSVTQGVFYTVVTYILTFPIALFVVRTQNLSVHPFLYWLALAVVLLAAPVVLPFAWIWLLRRRWISKLVQFPYPTPWDWYFSRRQPVFLLIHLADGSLVGGYWGEGSYASSYPDQGDLYLSAVYKVDEHGRFGAPINQTDGLLIRKDEYRYIELFRVPTTEVGNEQEIAADNPGT